MFLLLVYFCWMIGRKCVRYCLVMNTTLKGYDLTVEAEKGSPSYILNFLCLLIILDLLIFSLYSIFLFLLASFVLSCLLVATANGCKIENILRFT